MVTGYYGLPYSTYISGKKTAVVQSYDQFSDLLVRNNNPIITNNSKNIFHFAD